MIRSKFITPILVLLFVWVQGCNALYSQVSHSGGGDYPVEKVRLSTDRNLYISGETIWFTAVTSLERGSGNNFSQIVYIELYNANNKAFVQEKFKLADGRVSGFINIPEELPTDNYFLRAYTMYLRNFSPDTYATHCLAVINPEFPPEQTDVGDSLEVFTENEKLVAGIKNKIAFHLPARQVRNISGAAIYDTSGVFVTRVKFFNNGLGSVSFVPEDTNAYFLKFDYNDKDSLVHKLPDVAQGWMATSRISGDKLHYRISGNGFPEAGGPFQFSVWSQDKRRLFRQECSFENLKSGIEIGESILVPGINYLVLKSGNGELKSLSTLFKQPDFVNGPKIILSGQSYKIRNRVELKLSQDPEEINGIDYLQLSVIKTGTTFNPDSALPAVYVANPLILIEAIDQPLSQNMEEQIDAVLLMHNSNFRDQFLKSENEEFQQMAYIPDIRDVSVSGIVKNKSKGRPIAGLRIFASVLHDDFQFHSTTTATDGSFVFSLPHLQGKHDLFLSTEADSAANVEIFLNNDFSTQFTNVVETPPQINNSNRSTIEELLVNQQVSLNFPAFSEMKMDPVVTLPPWIRTDLITIVLSDYIPLATIQEVFNEIVTWVRMKEKDGDYKLTVFDDQSQLTYDDPLILVDGIPINDVNVLTKLYPAQVEQIKVLNRVFILGDLTLRGLISIKTKTDNFGGIPLPDDAVFVNYKTRSVPASFKLPDELPADLKSPNPWFKTLLYYAPIDSLPPEGKSIEFFTSDDASGYDIILKGKTRDGRLIFSKHSFEVESK